MNRKRVFAILAGIVCWCFVGQSFALDQTGTGFTYPIGDRNFDSDCGTWLARDRANGGCYEKDLYHIGVDMMTYSLDHQTYAVADGMVVLVDDSGSSWGSTDGHANSAVFIRHYTSQGDSFTCVYGHIQREVKKGDFVKAGGELGKTGDYSGGIHLHFGCFWGTAIPPTNKVSHRGWGRMGNDWWSDVDDCSKHSPDTNCFVDPLDLIRSHSPATLIPKGERSVFSIGSYLFRGSDVCLSASEWYKVTDSSRSDFWITEPASKADTCAGITETVERTLQSGENHDGSPKTSDIVTNESTRSSDVSWWSAIASWFKDLFSTSPAQAAEPSVQKSLTITRTGMVYAIAGTDREVFVLTDGPGMNGDKAIDSLSGYQSDPSETYDPGLSASSGKKLSDIGISDQWMERSSGNKHDNVDWGSTICPTVYVKSKGDADAPTDVKVSFSLSKGYKEDRSPKRFGSETIKRKDMKTGKSKTLSHCVKYGSDDYPSYPGRYNFTAVANSDKAFPESKMTNNKSDAYSFVINENAHLIVHARFLNEVVPGQSVSVAVTIENQGTPFNQDFVYTEYRIQGPAYGANPIILGLDQTRRDHLRTGDIANEELSFIAPTESGTYTFITETDYTNIVSQGDRSGDVFTLSFEIPEGSE